MEGKWTSGQNGPVGKGILLVTVILSLFLLAKTINEFKLSGSIGRDYSPENVISVSGEGEVVSVPDTANITFDITEEAKEVPAAQTKVTERMNAIIASLKGSGIDAKDIKTINYSVYPKYEYQNEPKAVGGEYIYPPYPVNQVIVGYTVTHTVEVKIRKVADAGSILASLGSFEVSNLSGLSFSIDDEDALKAEARKKAIDDAREKAEVLSRDLGVRLVRIVSFSESGNYPPIYYMKAEAAYVDGRGGGVAPTPEIPTGENKIVSNVTITYEIR